jgi:long-chain acyl-CoA synthetase
MNKPWLKEYSAGVAATIDLGGYQSILDVFHQSCKTFAHKRAYTNMGCHLTFSELEEKSRHFAAYLQQTLQLKKGERFAIMLPNILQYPVAMFGAFRAGLTVVNLNPLYTPRELVHLLNNTGATSIIVLSNFASVLEKALPETSVKKVIVTNLGDLFPEPKSTIVNFVIKYLKRMVPAWHIEKAVMFKDALRAGQQQSLQEVSLNLEDVAYLQPTGGTTGVPKCAMLLHRNMIANMQQMSAWVNGAISAEDVMVTPLPLYHIFSLCVNGLMVMKLGATNLLITNPRDIKGFVKELKQTPFTCMTGVNTLFNALINNDDFKKLDFSKFHLTIAGGMALQKVVAEKWKKIVGHYICEGYGLTETSPVVCANPLPTVSPSKGIGLPLPSTDIKIDEGELCVKGPQVMPAYWQSPEETAKVFTQDGYFRTGDIAQMADDGYCYIIDRKKNMISVSGLKVFPNEVEDVISHIPGVLEVAAIGVPDEKSGEVVKVFIVRKEGGAVVSEEAVKAYCHENLTAYKVPKYVEFRDQLPKTNIGKILHRALRE